MYHKMTVVPHAGIVAGRPSKCRPREVVPERHPNKACSSRPLHVCAEQRGSLGFQHHHQLKRFQRTAIQRRKTFVQLTFA